MSSTSRILIVDDNAAIHEDFKKTLVGAATAPQLDDLEAMLFEESSPEPARTAMAFDLGFALQGKDALDRVIEARDAGRPYALAFVDMRMPPGWDGLETIEQLWRADADLQTVICSAYSDYSWSEMDARLHARESVLILKKPFDTIEVVQCAHALTTKWALVRKVRAQVEGLEAAVVARTKELEEANRGLAHEMQKRARVEAELRMTHKLEAIGRLASGIAHEINTPIQYVGDHIQFLREGTLELLSAATTMACTASAQRSAANASLVDELVAIANGVDLEFLAKAMPESLTSAEEGVKRIAKIVRTMKELAHPGSGGLAHIDLMHVLDGAIDVSARTRRDLVDIETHFAELPPVRCFGDDLAQVFINIIVNAVQAMEDHPERRGQLVVGSAVDGPDVVITIADNAGGIPEAARENVFDAFFTTKDIGRGTGQGLAISRSIVVDRHGGSLTFETETGAGTTFSIRVPIAGPPIVAEVAA
ncbi:MAG TPA: ATP-binding protein [Kofleriaceae bacterium]|nr:ATP-binding protein [Kofleriaceae bacterium]